MYSATEVISNIEANMFYLMMFGTMANLLAYVQCIYGAYLGFRDRSHGVPLGAVVMFFAHDSYYVLQYDYWFNTVGHPFFTGNWYTMFIFAIVELVIAWQIITYSRKEVGLGDTWIKAFLSYVAIQTGACIMFLWIRSMFHDPLYLQCFAISVVFANLFNIQMLLRRGTRRAQSLIVGWALVFQTGIIYFFLLNPFLGSYFVQPTWLAAGVANTLLAGAYVWLLYKTPPYKRAESTTSMDIGMSGSGSNVANQGSS